MRRWSLFRLGWGWWLVCKFLTPRVVKRLGKARSISAGIIGLSVTSILLVVSQQLAESIDPLQWYNDWPFLAVIITLIFALGCELDLMNIPALTLIQEHTPDTIKGRVLSLQSIVYNAASIPVILFIGGIADWYGMATVMWVRRAHPREEDRNRRREAYRPSRQVGLRGVAGQVPWAGTDSSCR